MQQQLKTRDVAKEFGVTTKTVLGWVKKHELQLNTNEQGHYLFTSEDVNQLSACLGGAADDKDKSTSPARELPPYMNGRANVVDSKELLKKLEHVLLRLDHVERLVETKADEVVSFQLLRHRHDIDDLKRSVNALEHAAAEDHHGTPVPAPFSDKSVKKRILSR
ncbi:MerR family transcriptional regulator [Salsuginibacillus kocurii]|uniref:MerR family transcriptional regulator n=1 Tax=Salsuginibacillus kocurii TaxID=427078 RepID=UPI00037BE127|nr:MerR family transcriptional regulator [Salsuginibacillus kocurii]